MIRELIHDPLFLALPSEEASAADAAVAADLLDTLRAHKEECVGMAANMIGVRKRLIAFVCDGTYMIMYNPVIIKKTVYMIRMKGVYRYLARRVRVNGTDRSR